MTYKVSSGTLNLFSLTHSRLLLCTGWEEDGEREKVDSRVSCSSCLPSVCVVWDISVTHCCRPILPDKFSRTTERERVGTLGGCSTGWLEPAALPTTGWRTVIHTSLHTDIASEPGLILYARWRFWSPSAVDDVTIMDHLCRWSRQAQLAALF